MTGSLPYHEETITGSATDNRVRYRNVAPFLAQTTGEDALL
jgi:hypothetical protein